MRTYKAAIAALLGVGMLAPAPALAQAPNLGPDWELVGSRKVKNWVPHPTKPGSGKWELVDYSEYNLFQEDLENPIPVRPSNPAPDVSLGPVKKGKAYDEKGEVDRIRKGLLIHKYQTIVNVTPQSQTETTVHKGLALSEYSRVEARSRALRTKYGLYDISFQVPVKNFRWDVVDTGRTTRELNLDPILVSRVVELMPPDRASEVAALSSASGDRAGVFQGDSGSSGKAGLSASKLREKLGANKVEASQVALTAEQVEEARKKADEEARKKQDEENAARAKAEEERKKAAEEAAKAAQEAAAAAAAAAASASNPVINPGNGGNAAANAANAVRGGAGANALQNAAPAQPAGLSLDKILGKWTSSGGKSTISFARHDKGESLDIKSKLDLGRGDDLENEFKAVAYGQTWQVLLGKDGWGRKVYLKGSFNSTGTELAVKIWADGSLVDSTLAEGKFTKSDGKKDKDD